MTSLEGSSEAVSEPGRISILTGHAHSSRTADDRSGPLVTITFGSRRGGTCLAIWDSWTTGRELPELVQLQRPWHR